AVKGRGIRRSRAPRGCLNRVPRRPGARWVVVRIRRRIASRSSTEAGMVVFPGTSPNLVYSLWQRLPRGGAAVAACRRLTRFLHPLFRTVATAIERRAVGARPAGDTDVLA